MRHTLRLFARTPLASAAALGALALAIGASTLVFSVVDGILLQPLSYKDPDRLVVVWESNVGHGSMENVVAPANFLYWRDRQHVFTDMTAISPAFRVSVTAPGQAPEMIAQQSVTAALFPLLGVSPAIGRAFTEAEDVGQKQLAVSATGTSCRGSAATRTPSDESSRSTASRTRSSASCPPDSRCSIRTPTSG